MLDFADDNKMMTVAVEGLDEIFCYSNLIVLKSWFGLHIYSTKIGLHTNKLTVDNMQTSYLVDGTSSQTNMGYSKIKNIFSPTKQTPMQRTNKTWPMLLPLTFHLLTKARTEESSTMKMIVTSSGSRSKRKMRSNDTLHNKTL